MGFSGKNAGVGSLSLLQGIFPTQGSNPGPPHCRRILYCFSHKGLSRIPWQVQCQWNGGKSDEGLGCLILRTFKTPEQEDIIKGMFVSSFLEFVVSTLGELLNLRV